MTTRSSWIDLQRAAKKLAQASAELSIRDSAHRSRTKCACPFPLDEWAELNQGIIAVEKALKDLPAMTPED